MPVNLGVWFHYEYSFIWSKVFNLLKKRQDLNIKVHGFVLNGKYTNFVKQSIKDGEIIDFFNLLNEFKFKKPSYKAMELFSYYDEKYKLQKVYFADRYRQKIKFEDYKRIVANLIEFFEDFIKRNRITHFLFSSIETSYSLLLFFILKENNIRILHTIPCGIESRWCIIDNPYHLLNEACKIYKSIKSGNDLDLVEEFEEEAKNIIVKVRNELKGTYKDIGKDVLNFYFNILLRATPSNIFSYLKNYFLYYKKDYGQPTPLEKVLNNMFYIFRRKMSSLFWDIKEYNQLPKNFVFFPLQLYPEATTLIVSPYSQHCIIKEISKRIPMGWYLVVKEHPSAVGIRHLSFYRKLKKYPNVKIASPELNASELIRRSKVVFSLNGTPILESIILKRPVIFTGPSKYDCFGLGVRSKNILEFDKLIDKALSIKFNENDILYMIISIIATSCKFNFNSPFYDKSVMNKENMIKIANCILQKLKN